MTYARSAIILSCLLVAQSLAAQTLPIVTVQDDTLIEQEPPPRQTDLIPVQPGRVANSVVGEAGQRDIRNRIATTRVASRVQNRVQNRIRSRIDRYYDPQTNATDPFATAEDQARVAGRSK